MEYGPFGDLALMASSDGRGASPSDVARAPWQAGSPLSGLLSRPSLLLEQQLVTLELAQLLTSPTYYGFGIPFGDGSPIVLVPGFLGSDRYLSIMRDWLRRIGYHPHNSGLSFCAGSPIRLIAQVLARTDEIASREGRSVTLIGHSLGGILSCVVARLRPDIVSHVVTLGSPHGAEPRKVTNPFVAVLADMLVRESSTQAGLVAERMLERELFGMPLPEGVQLSCIYTYDDAVVDWRACVDRDPRTLSYRVSGTHSGLAFNEQVYRRLARQLAVFPGRLLPDPVPARAA